ETPASLGAGHLATAQGAKAGEVEEDPGEEDEEQGSRRGEGPHQSGAQGGRPVADEVVDAEGRSPSLRRGGAGHHHLLDREERPGLARSHGHVAQHGGQDYEPGVSRREKEQGRDHREGRQAQERCLRSPAVPRPAHAPGEKGASYERERHRNAHAYRGHPQLAQMDGEEDAEESVAERTDGLGGEDEADVARPGAWGHPENLPGRKAGRALELWTTASP